MPPYKTIALEFLKEQHPALHERLRSSRTLPQAVNDYATALRTSHLNWSRELETANPGCAAALISSEAMELAMRDLSEALSSASPTSGEGEGLSLDDAMSFLRRHTPPV